MNNLKPNNCYINFECTEPKKCVHYKKMKREPKPCKSCNVVDQCDIHFAVEYCPTWIEWNNNKSLCQHNQGSYGECNNTIAHVQAITRYLKAIGVSVTYGSTQKPFNLESDKNFFGGVKQ